MDFVAGLGIEARGRLVEEEHLRIVDEGEGQRQTLLLAARQLAVAIVPLLPELEALEQRLAIDAARVQAREEPKGLGDRDLVGKTRRLQAHADAILQPVAVLRRIHAQHRHLAARSGSQTLQDLHRRRLAGAVGSQQTEHFAGLDLEVDPLDGGTSAIVLREVDHGDGRRHHLTIRIAAAAGSGAKPRRVRPGAVPHVTCLHSRCR
jgi:hypothetical protein